MLAILFGLVNRGHVRWQTATPLRQLGQKLLKWLQPTGLHQSQVNISQLKRRFYSDEPRKLARGGTFI
jgi:hypothetical protein